MTTSEQEPPERETFGQLMMRRLHERDRQIEELQKTLGDRDRTIRQLRQQNRDLLQQATEYDADMEQSPAPPPDGDAWVQDFEKWKRDHPDERPRTQLRPMCHGLTDQKE